MGSDAASRQLRTSDITIPKNDPLFLDQRSPSHHHGVVRCEAREDLHTEYEKYDIETARVESLSVVRARPVYRQPSPSKPMVGPSTSIHDKPIPLSLVCTSRQENDSHSADRHNFVQHPGRVSSDSHLVTIKTQGTVSRPKIDLVALRDAIRKFQEICKNDESSCPRDQKKTNIAAEKASPITEDDIELNLPIQFPDAHSSSTLINESVQLENPLRPYAETTTNKHSLRNQVYENNTHVLGQDPRIQDASVKAKPLDRLAPDKTRLSQSFASGQNSNRTNTTSIEYGAGSTHIIRNGISNPDPDSSYDKVSSTQVTTVEFFDPNKQYYVKYTAMNQLLSFDREEILPRIYRAPNDDFEANFGGGVAEIVPWPEVVAAAATAHSTRQNPITPTYSSTPDVYHHFAWNPLAHKLERMYSSTHLPPRLRKSRQRRQCITTTYTELSSISEESSESSICSPRSLEFEGECVQARPSTARKRNFLDDDEISLSPTSSQDSPEIEGECLQARPLKVRRISFLDDEQDGLGDANLTSSASSSGISAAEMADFFTDPIWHFDIGLGRHNSRNV